MEATAASGECVNSTLLWIQLLSVLDEASLLTWVLSDIMRANIYEGALRRDQPRLPAPEKRTPDFQLNALIKRTVIAHLLWREEDGQHRENMKGLGRIDVDADGGHRGSMWLSLDEPTAFWSSDLPHKWTNPVYPRCALKEFWIMRGGGGGRGSGDTWHDG